ncbi:MAG: hypothetical protein SOW36_08185 [Porphyromonas sp.]|uniref:hypothetical protein n=2 Tax=Porphyromonas TaxID=836 RepID=UPI002A74A317|nr:hypothetical protein [Porphyromonas sp.]MDY3112599.1 hypothetical protein [Porphyromonas sp.]
MEENILLPFPSDYDEKLKVSSLDPNTVLVPLVLADSDFSQECRSAYEIIESLPREFPFLQTPEGVAIVRISKQARQKLKHLVGIYTKGFERDLYLSSLPYIEEILKNSLLLEEHRDRLKNEFGERLRDSPSDPHMDKVQRLYGGIVISNHLCRAKTTIHVFTKNGGSSHHGYEITEIELLAPKADRSQRESFQPLTSNSTDELLNPKTATPIEGRLQPLNSNSIDELISPKTGNLMQSEVDLPPLTSSISLAKLLKGVELSYEPNVKLLDAMQACHQFALTGDYTELVKVYETARNKRLSTTLSDPLQSVKQAQAEMVASTQQANRVVVPSSPVQEKAQAILNARGERNENTLKDAQEEQAERKSQSHKL